MLTPLSVDMLAPMPASSHVLNQPTGVGSPAGDSGSTDRGTVGTDAPVELVHTIRVVGGDAA